MSGADTWRGIAFQAALATVRALDVLDSQLGDWLDVDSGDDIVDYSSGSDGGLTLIGQAKTRSQPNTWAPAELAEVVRRLIAVPDGSGARLEFVTDGSLSRESASTLLPALDRVRDEEATDGDWTYLARHRLTAAAEPLKRLSIITRHDSAPALLDRAVRRVRELTDLSVPITDDEAELRVLRLLRTIDDRGSSGDDAASRLSRDEVGEIVGVSPQVVDHARPWSSELADQYRQSVIDHPHASVVVELETELESLQPSVTSIAGDLGTRDDQPRREPVLDLLDRDCLITGPAGAGKTRSLELLRLRAAHEGLVPVLLAPRTYEGGTLSAAVRNAVSRALGYVVAPSTGAVLIIDGVSELPEPEMRRLLARDVDEVRSRLAAATVIVSGRSVGTLRPLDLPAYRLVSLDRGRRREVAAELFGEDVSPLVAMIEEALGDASGNPLLFTMALQLAAAGSDVESVSSLYDGFVARLAERSQLGQEMETPLGVLGLVCVELVEQERFALDRWSWLLSMERAIATLTKRGLVDDLTAVDVLEAMQRVGLLVSDADQSGFSLLHDSFRDWLTARAIAGGLAHRPPAFGPAWSAVASHLAEAGADDREFLAACAADLVVASAAATREIPPASTDAELAADATMVLGILLATHLRPEQAQPWTQTQITIRQTTHGVTAYLLPGGAEGDLSAAIAGASFGEPTGPLRIAVMLFFERLKGLLARGPAYPAPIPDDFDELAMVVAEHFGARRDALDALADALVPTMAARVRDHLGWRGLRGRINPNPHEHFSASNTLHYTFDAADVSVDVSRESLPEATRISGAQDFIREAPERIAADALAGALQTLLDDFSRI
jgi:hypothetical protein